MKFKWVTIKVRDLDKSLSFYKELLGIDIAMKFGSPEHQIVMLGDPQETMVELICDSGAKDINPGNGASIGLELGDLDRLVGVLTENGYSVTGPMSPNPDMRFFFVQDPDGYTVQLVETKG